MAKTVASRKARGRNLQKWVRDLLLSLAPSLEPDDVQSTSMGASGEDVKLSPAARRIYPISVECKNSEKLSLWPAYEQAQANSKGFEPVLIVKKNRKDPLAIVNADWLIKLLVRK